MTEEYGVRKMKPDETGVLKRLARRSFGVLQGLFVKPTDETYVYELSGEVVGVIALATFRFRRDRLGGFVKWLYTDPRAQGRGVASELVSRGVSRLQELGCDELFTIVEGYNTGSSNRFADAGFDPVSPMQQVRRYGLSMFKIGPATFHVFDLGHFLWARPAKQADPVPAKDRLVSGVGASAWWMNVLMLSILYWLQGLRAGWMGEQSLHVLWQPALVIAVVLGVRSLAMKTVGRMVGLDLRYRMWETGLTLSAVVAAFGGLFLSTGSYYPRSVRWSYRSELPRLGPAAFAGALAVLVLGWLLYTFEATGSLGITGVVSDTLERAVLTVRFLLLFEVLLPFFPFGSFNGRRVLDYNRVLWVLLAVGAIALYWVSY